MEKKACFSAEVYIFRFYIVLSLELCTCRCSFDILRSSRPRTRCQIGNRVHYMTGYG